MDQEQQRRIEIANRAVDSLLSLVRKLQRRFYEAIIDLFLDFDTEDGKIKASPKNTTKVSGVFRIFRNLQEPYQTEALGSIQEWTNSLLAENKDYFAGIGFADKKADEYARFYTLFRWGYDNRTGTLIPGGYLSTLFNNQGIAQRVGGAINSAILSKIPLKEFQKQLKVLFVGNPGQGMLERHWKTNSGDLFQRIDRAANFAYAEQFGLNWAIYSGTLEQDSRPFCIARVNKVFNREQIQTWAELEFQGKPRFGYDPFMDCGGFNCRHHLSWISEAIAKQLLLRERNV